MSGAGPGGDPGRVLLLAPTSRDAAVTREALAAVGLACHVCGSLEEVCDEIGRGGAAGLLTQEAVLSDREGRLALALARQPLWSDFPLVVLTPAGPDSVQGSARALAAIGHMTLVKRPVPIQVLVSTVEAAVRDRRRQYAARDYFKERERHAEALRRQDERFRASFAHSSVGMAFTTPEGRFLEVNDAFCSIAGYPEAELKATHTAAITHPEDRPAYAELARRLLAGERPSFGIEMRYVRQDGSAVWVKNSVSATRDAAGRPTNVVVLTEDVTERKAAEAARRRTEDDLKFALETARMGSWDRDLVTGAFTCTAACKSNYGVPAGARFAFEDLVAAIHPDDRDRVGGVLAAAVERGGGYETEFRVIWPDGSPHWLLARGKAFLGPAGEPVRVVALNMDITERKRAEEALQDADRRKDVFLAMLAHELRNPLAAISGATRVFSGPTVEAEDLAWGRGVLERQVRQLSRLIDDLLDVSRINSGKIRLRRETFDAEPVLRSAVEVVRPLLADRHHELAVTIAPGPLRLHADPARVEQILVNLLTNAAKYTESGGRVSISAGREGPDVAFRVCDNGVGIPADQLPRMFELFAQGDRSLDRSEGGLGIGLTLVRALAEMHGGTVAATSPGAGRGSEFVVRLPAAAPAAAEAARPAAGADRAVDGSRVLVVDDNADAARGLARVLGRLGHEVRVAHGGAEAIEAARAHRPGVVLLDIGLPGMDGYEVAARLRAEPWCRSALLIAVTGYGQDRDRRRAEESGFDHHMVKPVDYDQLIKLLAGGERKPVDIACDGPD